MKKKFSVFIIIFAFFLWISGPDYTAWAASGSTSVSVSAGTLDIGGTVTVSVKASGPSGEKTVSTMNVSYDSSILQFESCSATYGGGGGSVTATSDSFTVTLKAVAAGTSAISVSGSDGVVFDTNEELESMSGSSASVTVNNAAAQNPGNSGGGNSGGDQGNGSSGAGGSTGGAGGSAGSSGGSNTGSSSQNQSADNSLKSLTISPGTLSPAFSGKNTKYSATVANDVTSIAVAAVPVHEKAVVESVSGDKGLSVGNNTVKIVVKAENGVTATYTVNVTRQAAGEEPDKKPVEEKPAETEETESEGETEEPGIMVGDAAYSISEDFKTEDIPADFAEATLNYHGTDYRSVSFDKGTVSMLFLVKDGTEDGAGKFFIYDATRDSLYPFVKLGNGDKYVIALLAPVDYTMPDTYLQTAVMVEGADSITAYQISAEEDTEIVSDFYMFYGVNHEGTEGWYQYDARESTYQRLNLAGTGEEGDAGADMEYLQKEYDALSKQYTKEKSFARTIMAILIFIVAALLFVIINLLLHRREKERDTSFLDEDDFEAENQLRTGDDLGAEDEFGTEDTAHRDGETINQENENLEENVPKEEESEEEGQLKEERPKKSRGLFAKRKTAAIEDEDDWLGEDFLEDEDDWLGESRLEEEEWLGEERLTKEPRRKKISKPEQEEPLITEPAEDEEAIQRKRAREQFFADEPEEKLKEKPVKRKKHFSDELEEEPVSERKKTTGTKEDGGKEKDNDGIEVMDLNDL